MSLARPSADDGLLPRQLLILAVPTILVGVLAALILWGMDRLSDALSAVIWDTVPGGLGIDPSGWWIILVLTVTGLAVGVALQVLPGHGGPDSATTELVGEPLPLRTLPGLALVTLLGLAGGVSLGPENPIIAINSAIVVSIFARFIPRIPTNVALLLGSSATIGALFGTPVAAALVLTGIVAAVKAGGSLWDKLFLPVAAAGAASVTMHLLGAPPFAFDMPAYGPPQAIDLLTGTLVACGVAIVGLAALAAFPFVYRGLHALRYPIVVATTGGLLLGILGFIGGPITMFKGLDQIADLLKDPAQYDPGQLAAIAGIKVLALLIAASALFRGGRIFPSTFIGVALGLMVSAIFPALPLSLVIASAVLGIVLVVGRDGWLALFVAVAVGGDITLLPVLCLIVLPAWLLVSRAPEFRIVPVKVAATAD